MSPESVDSRPVVDPGPELVVPPQRVVVHATTVLEQGSFVVSECTCGWRSYARRSRPLARREGRDHELLHAPTH